MDQGAYAEQEGVALLFNKTMGGGTPLAMRSEE
jgi:hypothetical protein